jgi:uncharacterized protein YjbI with pentapeptide repeats
VDDGSCALAVERRTFAGSAGAKLVLDAKRIAAALRTNGGPLVFQNVEVVGDLEIQEARVVAAVRFVDCTFAGVHAERAVFSAPLSFTRCRIKRFRGYHAHFDDVRFNGGSVKELACANTVVDKTLSFVNVELRRTELNACRIAGNLRIRRLRAGTVVAQRALVTGICDLRELSAAHVDLDGLRAARINASGAMISASASFDRIEIEDAVNLSGARIGSLLNMRSAKIGHDLDFHDAELRGLDLSGTTVSSALILRGTVVRGNITAAGGDFGRADCSAQVTGNIRITDAAFRSCRLSGIAVSKDLVFTRNSVSGTLTIEPLKAQNPRVGGHCSLSGTHVGGQIVVRHLAVTDHLSLLSVTATDVLLYGASAGKGTSLAGVAATARITLDGIRSPGLDLSNASAASVSCSNAECGALVAANARITGSCTFKSMNADQLSITHSTVTAVVRFEATSIARKLDLSRTRIGSLEFGDELVDETGSFSFPGSTVMRNVEFGSLQGSLPDLLTAFARGPQYDSTAYRAIEGYARGLGRSDWADRVYLASKRHATRALPSGMKRGGQGLLDFVSGYGARPLRLIRAIGIVFGLMVAILFVQALFVPRILGRGPEPWYALVLRSGEVALDILVRGEHDLALEKTAGPMVSAVVQAVLDVVIVLRYVALGLLGLWVAYITGLVRYVGGTKG